MNFPSANQARNAQSGPTRRTETAEDSASSDSGAEPHYSMLHSPGPAARQSRASDMQSSPYLAAMPQAGVRKCQHCDTYVYASNGICPECGEDLQLQPRLIRCSRCRQEANSELVICPHCARGLKAAPSRVWTVGAPAVLALLFAVVLVGRFSGMSLDSNLLNGALLNGAVGTSAASEPLLVMTPVPGSQATEAAAQSDVAQSDAAQADAVAIADPETGSPDGERADGDAGTTVQATVQDSAVVSATESTATGEVVTETTAPADAADGNDEAAAAALASAEAELDNLTQSELESRGIGGLAGIEQATATPAPTSTPTSTPASAPTRVPTATAMPTVTPVAAADEDTDTQDGDAGETSAGEELPGEELEVRAASALMPTPTPGSPEGAASSDDAVANVATDAQGDSTLVVDYTVQPGDTIIGIASRHGTTAEDILALNNMTEQDAQRMRAGDIVSVPDRRLSQRAVASATPVAGGTAATGDADDYRLAAPVLRSPGNGAVVECSNGGRLTWQPIPYMETTDSYLLHLGFVSGRESDGRERVTWVLAQPRPANITSWELDTALCSLAPSEYGRQWRWWVEAVAQVDGAQVDGGEVDEGGMNGETEAVSPPSSVWTFIWNRN